jgi:uncharacterized protein with HEPN domain
MSNATPSPLPERDHALYRLAHAYLGIEPETVWMLIEHSVPNLKVRLSQLLSRIGA